jgi:hypothetical protein
MGYAVVQLVEALFYKPDGRGFDSWCGHWIFHWLNPSIVWPCVGSASNRNEYQTNNLAIFMSRLSRNYGSLSRPG